METSTDEQRNRSEETSGLYYSPCYFFDQVIKSFLKCLGHDSTTEQPQPQSQHPPLHAEREMKFTEEFAVNGTKSSRGNLRRPPRPPISSGGGGQINQSSS
ncbi:hypothetical protein F2P56_001474 [Juglans regia]|uniref:Elicitor peptide 6-like n=2 Tax=Juglans regia TaxID=51240 RepID=A0A833YD46_JUGRE|nr:elicitor peptide 6-like [Juglans regia]KAF5480757.1 hypothetical protein F2P56_001474 [Juglans regia]